MAKGKVKEPTLRERVIFSVAQSLMGSFDLGEIPFTKEGLVLGVEEEAFVVKVIQKKNPIYQEDIKGMIEFVDVVYEPEAEANEADEAEGDEVEEAI